MKPIKFYVVVLWLTLVMNNCRGLKDSKNAKKCCSVCKCSGNDYTVDCSDRNLKSVPRCEWSLVRTLELQGNNITVISAATMQAWRNLRNLDLSNNQLSTLPVPVNVTMNLRELYLRYNKFQKVPSSTFSKMPKLNKIDFSHNKISSLQKNDFTRQRRLEDLILSHNELAYVNPGFMGRSGSKLIALDLSSTKLRSLPFESIRKLKKLKVLDLESTPLEIIPDLAFQHLEHLAYINIDDAATLNRAIGNQAFCFLPALKTLTVTHARLTQFPNLTGTGNLTEINFRSNQIKEIPDDLCNKLKHLELIDMIHNELTNIPRLQGCSRLIVVEMAHNEIQYIGDSFHELADLLDINLAGNNIKMIGENDLKGLGKLEVLFLGGNKITSIHENAFSSFKKLQRINLKDSRFSRLPTKGLQTVTWLSVEGNTMLTDFPSPKYFPHLQILKAQSPYHCCLFAQLAKSDNDSNSEKSGVVTQIQWLTSEDDVNISDFGDFGFSGGDINITNEFKTPTVRVQCTPQPDPFFPCKDLMGDWVLRCGVWIVFLLALAGNATVIIVILASHTKMDVSRFLISNLAFADLFMGIYLGFLAIVDATTLGDFKRYALDWQLSAGCQTAGFLAVLSSELSVFTLTVITLERYIAIKNAIRVNRKLELKTAMIVMAIGWLFAIATASLPLVQVSSYGKFSVCLPFETSDTPSIVFITILLCLNASAFVVILCCYILMYCSIRGSNAWNASDFRVAKRMALLVITDFLCWAPIVFLSLTAAFGSTLVSLDHAKIITVFVFPLNSCANPFLYAIFTSHFKKDLVAMCRRVEDKYPFLKITKYRISFSRRSSYSGAASENANIYQRVRKYSLPVIGRGFQNSVTSHDKGGSSTNSNNKTVDTNTQVTCNSNLERETSV